MKNNMFPRVLFVYILAAGMFSLPFLYVYHVTLQWNPFAINGKEFLVFYGTGIITGYFTLLLSRKFAVFPLFLSKWMIVLLVAGLARLCQGLYYHKPVGYLLLLVMSLLLLWQQVLYIKKR
ncbi:hypothetical protein [Chitinophaga polysaccharea]|uniref:hypothetical protein n=1 Tax=Chitinophaga polysaccharea TaxID=1293035 RepID=UPI00115AE3B3|nr:hypothetical protein [Chitinophaga polysaccharea]